MGSDTSSRRLQSLLVLVGWMGTEMKRGPFNCGWRLKMEWIRTGKPIPYMTWGIIECPRVDIGDHSPYIITTIRGSFVAVFQQ